MQRRHFIRTAAVAASLLAGAASFPALAQGGYPNKPISMVVTFPLGGTLDTVARALAQKMGEQMGQTVVVDNRPGGACTIGAVAVKNAPADGYTLLFSASTVT